MRVVIGVLVVLHLLGAAAIIGPWLAAPRAGRIRMAMVWGARAQVVTGILLVGLHEMSTDPADQLNRTKIGVKLVVALACVACAEIATRQRRALAATDPGAGEGGGRRRRDDRGPPGDGPGPGDRASRDPQRVRGGPLDLTRRIPPPAWSRDAPVESQLWSLWLTPERPCWPSAGGLRHVRCRC